MNALEEGSAWKKIAYWESGPRSKEESLSIRAMVLAAHPDDETIGASAVLGRLPNSTVVYLTDGAPRDRELWSAGGTYSREEYVRIRRDEAEAALGVLGIPSNRIFFLDAVDQESVLDLDRLIGALSALIDEQLPDAVITHPYEGGHPDHDSAALVAALAIASLKSDSGAAPELLEMTSYHDRDGKLVIGEFLPESSLQRAVSEEVVIQLSSAEVTRKKRTMECHRSQKTVLGDFSTELPERLRIAPKYDFGKPPHPGKLRYEIMGWKVAGEQWRKLALDAIEEFSSRSSSMSLQSEGVACR